MQNGTSGNAKSLLLNKLLSHHLYATIYILKVLPKDLQFPFQSCNLFESMLVEAIPSGFLARGSKDWVSQLVVELESVWVVTFWYKLSA